MEIENGDRKKDILIIISLFFVAFLIRVFGVSKVLMNVDEWWYWIDTNKILASNFAPRADVFDYSPPFLQYIGAVVTLFFEGDLNTLRMISVIFGSLTVPLLYLFGKVTYNRKTGLLSALFLCFSAYHCLYSHIYLFEGLTLFFITAFLYFFWLSQRYEHEQKSVTYAIYAIIAGAMMGLAFDAKYIAFFLIPAIIIYILWARRFSLKALLDKRIILMFIFAFLFFLPLLICLFYTGVGFHGIYYYCVEKFERATISSSRSIQIFSPDELLLKGTEKLLFLLTWSADSILIPSWTVFFKLSAISLFVITFFYYLRGFINRGKRDSFFMIHIVTLFLLLLVLSRSLHYLIYLLPFYFVMLSHLAVKSFEYLKKGNNSYKNIFRILIVSLTIVMLFSYIITGVTSPYWDEGDYNPWLRSAIEYIEMDIAKSGYEGNIVIGVIDLPQVVDYPLYLDDINASVYNVMKFTSGYERERQEIDLEKIEKLKPSYLMMSEHAYDFYFKSDVKKKIFEDYRIVFRFEHFFDGGLVLKRYNMPPSELLLPTEGKEGQISKDVFRRSIPGVMKVGEVYTALIKLKNTGDSGINFIITVYSDEYIIFLEAGWSGNVTLDKGSSRMLRLKIVPFREYTGEIPITVEVYAKLESGTIKKVDSVTDYVYRIEK